MPTVAPYRASIEVGGRDGITGTKGFEVIGATRSQRLEPAPLGEDDLLIWKCGAWGAVQSHRPPNSQVLYVVGRCVFPTAGYWVDLRRHGSQGSNPKDLLLELVVHANDGPRERTVVEASYSEETDFQYDTVTILPDEVSVESKRRRKSCNKSQGVSKKGQTAHHARDKSETNYGERINRYSMSKSVLI